MGALIKCRDCKYRESNYLTSYSGVGIYEFSYCNKSGGAAQPIVDPDVERECKDFRLNSIPFTLTDFDECECGDYRHQHENGIGRCTMPNDICHGMKPCEAFRLSARATEVPSAYIQSGGKING